MFESNGECRSSIGIGPDREDCLPEARWAAIAPGMFTSLDEFRDCLKRLAGANADWRAAAEARQATLTKPPGSLGRLEDLAIFLSGWGRGPEPCAANVRAVVFAGNHGVTGQGVSPYPPEVTAQMVANFEAGGAAINALAGAFDVALRIVPLALDRPTQDITLGPALTDAELTVALNAGADVVDASLDLLVLGEMGIGNTTIAAALCATSFDGDGVAWVGPGTGLDADGIRRKADVVDRALARHASARNAVDRLGALGGHETAAIAGAIVAARHARVPVLVDGFVVTASLAPLFADNRDIVDHCIAAHRSGEPGHGRALQAMGLEPLLDLGMRLGEGTGAALAVPLLRAAVAAHNGMATFEEAAVSGRTEKDGAG